MRFFNIFLTLIGPMIFLLVVISPRDALREFRFVFDTRIIRRGLRIPRVRFGKRRELRFSLRSLLIVTTLVAVHQACLLPFQGADWYAMCLITLFAAFVFVATIFLTSCKVPRRVYPSRYDHASRQGRGKPMPRIEVDRPERFASSDWGTIHSTDEAAL